MQGAGRFSSLYKLILPILISSLFLITTVLHQSAGADNWTPTDFMVAGRAFHTATRLLDGRVLVAGGTDGAAGQASAEIYSPNLSTWSPVPLMNDARSQHTATLLADGKVLVAGGTNNGVPSGSLASAEIYDPATNSWSAASAMISPRYAFTATLLGDGRVLVAGGINSNGDLSSAEIYNPSDNTWSAILDMTTQRSFQTASLLSNGRVLIAGGAFAFTGISSAEIYDADTGIWVTAASMQRARFGHAAATLQDGSILVTGGNDGINHLAQGEIYNPDVDTWSAITVPDMSTSRSYHIATTMPDGRVIVTGGVSDESSGIPLVSAEIYNPSDNTWSPEADMGAARSNHTGTLLFTGQLLITGGFDPNFVVQNSAETLLPLKPQSITFNSLPDIVFGTPDFPIFATASSGLPVSFDAAGDCTVSGNTISIMQPGECTITANQSGNSIWQAATPVSHTFAIIMVGPPVPVITRVLPISGSPGSPITITGINFGETQQANTVTFNGTPATSISSWTSRSIVAILPVAATSGDVLVTTEIGVSNGVPFTVTGPPAITQLSPVSGPIGTAVTITGDNFGATRANGKVTFSGSEAAIITKWTATSIVAIVPPGTTTGDVVVYAGVLSNSSTFTVTSANYNDPGNVLTYHNDNARSGQYLTETTLTPANVNGATFGKLFSYPVDGYVFGQPLYISNVSISGVNHNVVYVATQHDSVYAYDADNPIGGELWHSSFIDPAAGISTVLPSDVSVNDIRVEIGITSTPVIDGSTGTMYVIAKTREVRFDGLHFVQRLHALDITTGAEKFGGPALIADTMPGDSGKYTYLAGPSVPGTGTDSDENGTVNFNALRQLNRPALLLKNGIVYSAWGSHGDYPPYHGWILGHDAQTLASVVVFNTTPNGADGAIWMSGGGPAADEDGNIFVATSNGTFDLNGPQSPGYSDSLLKLSTNPTPDGNPDLKVTDSFTPWNQDELSIYDRDFGSGGVLLLPDQPGTAHPHMMIIGSKAGELYLMDRDNLGGYQQCGPECDNALQVIPVGTVNPVFDTPAYFNGLIYYHACCGDVLKAFQLGDGQISPEPVMESAKPFAYPGSVPSVSANGSNNGIIWVLERADDGILHAYDAANLDNELFSSNDYVADHLDGPVKYTVPTIAKGKVFVGTQGALTVFGLLPTASANLSVSFDGKTADRLGQGEALLAPDGLTDAVFTLTLQPGGGTERTVTSMKLLPAAGNEEWDTTPNNDTWTLAAAADLEGDLYNAPDGSVNFLLTEGNSIKIFAADTMVTAFGPGVTLKFSLLFSDNSRATARVTLPSLPEVTVTAKSIHASEAGTTGTFTITRTGSTDSDLLVDYELAGTADNGADYQALSGTVLIPAGSSTSTVTVEPIADEINEGDETVVLTLTADNGESYVIGSPDAATVTIEDYVAPGAPALSFSLDGTGSDRVGTGDSSLSPDGQMDGVFSVSLLPGSGSRTMSQLVLSRNSGGNQWNTISNDGIAILGAAATATAPLYNAANGTVNFALDEGGSFKIFASDDHGTLFEAGSSFTLTATFSDQSTASASITVAGESRVNVALASSGSTAVASSTAGSDYSPNAAINGDRKGVPWGGGGGWNDDSASLFPDWLEVDFSEVKMIEEIDVFTLQDNYAAPADPTSSMTFTLYGITDFHVQFWNGSIWQDVPGGSVTGNNRVWRQFVFGPILTNKIRVLINNAQNGYSRITEVEAYGTAAAANNPPSVTLTSPANMDSFVSPATISLRATAGDADGTISRVDFYAGSIRIATSTSTSNPYTATWSNVSPGNYTITATATDNLGATTSSSPAGIAVTGSSGTTPVNVALLSNGGIATASSSVSGGGYGPAGTINGDRKGQSWGSGGGWNDDSGSTFPDWLQIDLNGTKTIQEVDVFTVQDNYASPADPTPGMTFTLYGITDFQVQYWNGSVWQDVPGGAVTGNHQVWRQFIFSPISTSRIRILVNGALNDYSRITEVEAYTSTRPSNILPAVSLISPSNGNSFISPATISLSANASDTDGTISRVEFYAGASLIATSLSTTNPFTAVWTNAAPGAYAITAVATDNDGGSTTSAPVSVTVTGTSLVNYALQSNGGVATASSAYSGGGYGPAGTNNGDRKGLSWASGGGWNDDTPASFPDWLQIDFNGTKSIQEIDVFTVQDNYAAPAAPITSMTFSQYGITDFQVQYWNGSSWQNVPGGTITGNNHVWSQILFSPVSTSRIRVLVNNAMADYSRITEVEAYGN